jgi:hypothetical protein
MSIELRGWLLDLGGEPLIFQIWRADKLDKCFAEKIRGFAVIGPETHFVKVSGEMFRINLSHVSTMPPSKRVKVGSTVLVRSSRDLAAMIGRLVLTFLNLLTPLMLWIPLRMTIYYY